MLKPNEILELIQLVKCITLHWTAGNYIMTFNDYHFCIQFIDGKAIVKQTLSLKKVGAHTWRRNTGNIGISVCSMGPGYPTKAQQKEVMAKLVAELCVLFKLDLKGTYKAHHLDKNGNQLSTTFDCPIVTDHRYYAEKDGYPNLRVDIRSELLGKPGVITLNEILKKAEWYHVKLIKGEIKREYTLNLY